jgi:Restriction endonuclease AspBHI N-terminal
MIRSRDSFRSGTSVGSATPGLVPRLGSLCCSAPGCMAGRTGPVHRRLHLLRRQPTTRSPVARHPRLGNEILADAIARTHADREAPSIAPVFLIFHSNGVGRSVQFLGLAVPGPAALSSDADLVAVWRTLEGQRFQNYRAKFTVLSVPVVTRGLARASPCLRPSRRSGAGGLPFLGKQSGLPGPCRPRVGQIRSKSAQLPAINRDAELVRTIYERCREGSGFV